MMKAALIPIIIALGTHSSLPLRAQDSDCARRWVPVDVIGRDGTILTELQVSSIQGSLRGVPVKILSASWDEQPRRVLVLLDGSGSMTGATAVRGLALNVADQVAAQMPQTAQVGLAVFSVQIDQTVAFTTDRQAFHLTLVQMAADTKPSPKGRYFTALRDAMVRSLPLFGRPQEGDVLYVITDGADNWSDIRWGGLQAAILEARVRVFAMLVVDPLNPEGRTGSAELQDLADSTGGVAVSAYRNRGRSHFPAADLFSEKSGKPTRLALDLSRQVSQIAGYSRLQVELPEPVYKSAGWELRLADAKELKGSVLVYPHKLTPCSASGSVVSKPK